MSAAESYDMSDPNPWLQPRHLPAPGVVVTFAFALSFTSDSAGPNIVSGADISIGDAEKR